MLEQHMRENGLSVRQVAAFGEIPDPATVRAFVRGESWPWTATRTRIEKGAGLPIGSLEAAANNEPPPIAEDKDRVIAAIEESTLTPGDKYRLIGAYYDMLGRQPQDAASDRGA